MRVAINIYSKWSVYDKTLNRNMYTYNSQYIIQLKHDEEAQGYYLLAVFLLNKKSASRLTCAFWGLL